MWVLVLVLGSLGLLICYCLGFSTGYLEGVDDQKHDRVKRTMI